MSAENPYRAQGPIKELVKKNVEGAASAVINAAEIITLVSFLPAVMLSEYRHKDSGLSKAMVERIGAEHDRDRAKRFGDTAAANEASRRVSEARSEESRIVNQRFGNSS